MQELRNIAWLRRRERGKWKTQELLRRHDPLWKESRSRAKALHSIHDNNAAETKSFHRGYFYENCTHTVTYKRQRFTLILAVSL